MDTRPLPPQEESPEQRPPLAPPWKRLSAWVGLLALALPFAPLAGLALTAAGLITGQLGTKGLTQGAWIFLGHGMAFQGAAVGLAVLTWILALLRPKAQRAWYIDGRLWALAACFMALPILLLPVQDAFHERQWKAQDRSQSGADHGTDAERRLQVQRAAEELGAALINEVRRRDEAGAFAGRDIVNDVEAEDLARAVISRKRWGADPQAPLPLGLEGVVRISTGGRPLPRPGTVVAAILRLPPNRRSPYGPPTTGTSIDIRTSTWQGDGLACYAWELPLNLPAIRAGQSTLRPADAP